MVALKDIPEDNAGSKEDSERDARESAVSGALKKQTFGQAFASARKAGDKNFTFEGKKYTTKLKDAKKASVKDAEVSLPISTTSPASMADKERSSEMTRIQARGSKDRMGESAAGRVMQSLMNRSREGEAVPSRETPSFSSLKGMTMREKMAAMRSGMKKGSMVKKYKQGGTVSSASKRADGVAIKGKTKGRFV